MNDIFNFRNALFIILQIHKIHFFNFFLNFHTGGTSDLFNGGTGDPFATGRLEEGDPQAVDPDLDIVRDYSPKASPQPTTTAPPTVQRDFQADNIIIPQTVQPQDDSGLNIPVLSLQETGGLADDSTRNPSPATLPDDLVIIRDQQNEESVGHAQTSTVLSGVFVHSRLSETNFATRPSGVDVQTVNSSPLQVVTSRNLEDLQVERDEESPDLVQVIPTDVVETTRNVTSGSDDVSNLPVARDREEGSTSQTLPPDLVVIRDSVEDEDSGHIVTTRVTNSPSQLSTKQIGNGILILLPGDGGK